MRAALLVGLFSYAIVTAASSSTANAETTQILNLNRDANLSTPVARLASAETKQEADKPKAQKRKKKQTVHKVTKNDHLSKIAKKYDTTWRRLYDKNTFIKNPDIINVGDKVVIPEDNEKLKKRELPKPSIAEPQQKAVNKKPAAQNSNRSVANPKAAVNSKKPASSRVARGSSAGNTYVPGNCTWYAKDKRPDLPNNLGNADTWVSRAAAQGIPTGSTPKAGAVGQRGMHVVYVEKVNSDGTVTISEMNHKGLYIKTTRTLPADYFYYIY